MKQTLCVIWQLCDCDVLLQVLFINHLCFKAECCNLIFLSFRLLWFFCSIQASLKIWSSFKIPVNHIQNLYIIYLKDASSFNVYDTVKNSSLVTDDSKSQLKLYNNWTRRNKALMGSDNWWPSQDRHWIFGTIQWYTNYQSQHFEELKKRKALNWYHYPALKCNKNTIE